MECPPGGLSASSGNEAHPQRILGWRLIRISTNPTNTSLTNAHHTQHKKRTSLSTTLVSLYIANEEKEKTNKKTIEKARRKSCDDEARDSQEGAREEEEGDHGGGGGGGEGKEKGAGACELCGAAARVYCGADEATLCWGCDAQVHGANFLVARHARALLCRGCAQPTPWRAAGPRLGLTASLCERCVRRGSGHGRGGVGAGGGDEMAGEGDGREDEDDEEVVVEEDDEEEGEGENQVVPWAEDAEATPPPVASSTSSSSREAAANGANDAECAKEDVPCSTSQPSFCRYASSAHHGGRSDEATSSRNGGRFLASRHRKRSPSDFLSSESRSPGAARRGGIAPMRPLVEMTFPEAT